MSQFPAYPWKSKMKEHSGTTQVLLRNLRAKWKPRILLTQRVSESQKDKSGYGKGKAHYKWYKIHKKKTINIEATWKCQVSLLKVIYSAIPQALWFLYNTQGLRMVYAMVSVIWFLKCHFMISNSFKVSCPLSLSFSMFLKTLTKIQKLSKPHHVAIFVRLSPEITITLNIWLSKKVSMVISDFKTNKQTKQRLHLDEEWREKWNKEIRTQKDFRIYNINIDHQIKGK